MRISLYQHKILANYARIYLDGELLGMCSYADDQAGMVRIQKLDGTTVTRTGVVKIEFQDLPSELENSVLMGELKGGA